MVRGFPQVLPLQLVPKWGREIQKTKIDDVDNISFNFRRLKSEETKFHYTSKDSQYFLKLVDRLKNLCTYSKKELVSNTSKSLRCHKINFSDPGCSEKSFGFLGDVDDDAFQVEVSANEHGRIHGYFVGSTFYVVWLDPKHELYPGLQG